MPRKSSLAKSRDVDGGRENTSALEWKPIGTRIRGRPRKSWIEDMEEDMQILRIRR
jgi:hypothetical protein